MNELFSLDLQDYDPSWPVYSRASVRGLIFRDGKVLMIYSKKYQYYKFPGGGIEESDGPEEGSPNRAHANALIREVLEESGAHVIPESIREYGCVPRRQKSTVFIGQTFLQENFYYFCEVEKDLTEQKLDDYEQEEGFTPVWIDPLEAWHKNRHNFHGDADPIMIKRETKVLNMIDKYVREEKHRSDETAWIAGLGAPYYADMLQYVGEYLGETTGCMETKLLINYSRFAHIKRVLGWALRLYERSTRKHEIDYNTLVIATIFHDVGYHDMTETLSHQAAGASIARAYLTSHGYDGALTDRVCYLVEKHSDKWMMTDPAIPADLLMLMEADLLDDMGALGITMDCMIERGNDPRATFVDALDHISRYTLRQQHNNPMVTPEGRSIWEQKTALTEQFYRSLESDVLPWA